MSSETDAKNMSETKAGIAALTAGALFGAGLALSGMMNPAKVTGFLDFAGIGAGTWDPTLAFVMAGGLIVFAVGFRLSNRHSRPLFAPKYLAPAPGQIDRRLIAGAVMFGVGWGIAGLCPGPALAALVTAQVDIVIYFAAMAAGMALFAAFDRKR
jgi:uncharacterized membrane protein YedE/YeeE